MNDLSLSPAVVCSKVTMSISIIQVARDTLIFTTKRYKKKMLQHFGKYTNRLNIAGNLDPPKIGFRYYKILQNLLKFQAK